MPFLAMDTTAALIYECNDRECTYRNPMQVASGTYECKRKGCRGTFVVPENHAQMAFHDFHSREDRTLTPKQRKELQDEFTKHKQKYDELLAHKEGKRNEMLKRALDKKHGMFPAGEASSEIPRRFDTTVPRPGTPSSATPFKTRRKGRGPESEPERPCSPLQRRPHMSPAQKPESLSKRNHHRAMTSTRGKSEPSPAQTLRPLPPSPANVETPPVSRSRPLPAAPSPHVSQEHAPKIRPLPASPARLKPVKASPHSRRHLHPGRPASPPPNRPLPPIPAPQLDPHLNGLDMFRDTDDYAQPVRRGNRAFHAQPKVQSAEERHSVVALVEYLAPPAESTKHQRRPRQPSLSRSKHQAAESCTKPVHRPGFF